jgi:hypothetical protein
MLDLCFGRHMLGVCLAVVMLAGCGGAQNATSGVVAQGVPALGVMPAGHAAHGKSWMLPEAKGRDLLYAGSPATNDVYVYSYPGGRLVGTLSGLDDPLGLCSDTSGNIWITNADNSRGSAYLVEYAHGGTNPIATLNDSGVAAQACSVDPTTGNLAVGNLIDNIAVYKNARGKPKHYVTSCCVYDDYTLTYDGSGDAIFANWTTQSGWLPKGAAKVRKFKLRPRLSSHGPFEWDGTYLGVLASSKKPSYEEVIRYKVSGSTANQVGTVPLNGVTVSGQFWIQDSGMVLTNSSAR